MPKAKDPRLERIGVEGFNKPKRTPDHPTKSHVVVAKEGDTIGEFKLVRSEYVGKNRIWVCQCKCGKEKVFWKYSAISRQETCGCGTDEAGFTGKQRRSINSRMQGYKSGAAKRGFAWELSYEEFARITAKPCFYCGSEAKDWDCMSNAPSLKLDSPHANPQDYKIKFSGVDRFDSDGDYTVDNCVPCCVTCNRAKSNLEFSQFKLHVERMYKWLFPQK
jgi:hypothetical protein